MIMLFVLGTLTSLAALGSGLRVMQRTHADQRRIQMRLKQYAGR